LKLLVINAQLQIVLINSLFFILFTNKIITRDNYIKNNISYFFNNLPYKANGYEMIFTHILTHLLNEINFLPLPISNKLTKKNYPYPSYRIRYESGKKKEKTKQHNNTKQKNVLIVSYSIHQIKFKLNKAEIYYLVRF
jgi:hypothetical protein